MGDELTFEHIDAADVGEALLREVVALYALAFGKWPSYEVECEPWQHLRWKISNPAAPGGLLIGLRGGKLVQASTIRCLRIRFEGRSCRMVQHPDAAVHPDEQGRGVYRAALEHIFGPRRAAGDLNIREMGVHPAMAQVDRRISRPVGNQVRTLMRVLDARRVMATRDWVPGSVRRLVAWPMLTCLQVVAGLTPGRRSSASGEIERFESFDAKSDALEGAVAGHFDVLVERSADQQNWRYCDPAAGRFSVHAWVDAGEWLGYSVVRLDPTRWELADLLVTPGRTDVLDGLILDVVQRAAAARPAAVSAWLPARHPYRGRFRRSGFVDVHARGGICYEPADYSFEDLAALARRDTRLHFMRGDTDQV